MPSLCIVEIHGSHCQHYENMACCVKVLFLVDLSGPRITTYLGLHVEGPMITIDLNQMWGSWTDIHKVPNIKYHRYH